MKRRLLETTNSLPIPLRLIIAERLGEGGEDIEFSLSLLQLYDLEKNNEVKTQASIGYHNLLKESGKDQKQAVVKLSKNILGHGFDFRARQNAAFCGLGILEKFDILQEAIDKKTGLIELRDFRLNMPLLNHLFQNWEKYNDAFGDKFLGKIVRHSNSLYTWSLICPFIEGYPAPAQDLLRELEMLADKKARKNILRFLSKTKPKSSLLLKYCIKQLEGKGGWRDQESLIRAIAAAEILGEHFGGDREVLKQVIPDLNTGRVDEKTILVLCEGWPESEELDSIFKEAKEKRINITDNAISFRLACRKSESKKVFEWIEGTLEFFTNSRINSNFCATFVRPVIRRLKNDKTLQKIIIDELKGSTDPSEKITFTGLIAESIGLQQNLRTWCIEEVDRQVKIPEVGIDLLRGAVRPVAYSLLDITQG